VTITQSAPARMKAAGGVTRRLILMHRNRTRRTVDEYRGMNRVLDVITLAVAVLTVAASIAFAVLAVMAG
jgi:hypothetical protein